jgi:hypothetical protein
MAIVAASAVPPRPIFLMAGFTQLDQGDLLGDTEVKCNHCLTPIKAKNQERHIPKCKHRQRGHVKNQPWSVTVT